MELEIKFCCLVKVGNKRHTYQNYGYLGHYSKVQLICLPWIDIWKVGSKEKLWKNWKVQI